VALLAPDPRRTAPAPPAQPPAPDRAPDWVAAGTPEPLRSRLEAALGSDRVLTRALDLVAYASDASPYHLIPQAVVVPRDVADVVRLLRCATQLDAPLVFRAGGTSLNGQAQTDSILVDARRHWRRIRIEDGGARARVQPGAVLGHVNRLLARHDRRLGPDPASTGIACVGGVIANNSGGMRCGVVADSYRTVSALTFVLAGGAVIDTGRAGAEEAFAAAAPELAAGLTQIRDELRADAELAVRLPGGRLATGDLSAAAGRLRGNARLPRRGGVRDRPARAAQQLGRWWDSRTSTAPRTRSKHWSPRAPPPPS